MSTLQTLVLFDIDGTLLYSDKVDSRSFAQTYERVYNNKFPTIDWRRYPHVSDHTIFSTVIKQHFDREPDQNEIDHFQDQFVSLIQQKRKETPTEFKEVPGAKAIIELLMDQEDYCVGIATGGWQKPAAVKLAHIGIDFTHLHDSYADNKETREHIVQHAIDQAQAATGETIQRIVYIGDAIWDVETSRNMGLNFIGIRLKGDHDTLHQQGAEYVMQNYSDQNAFMDYLAIATPPI